MATPSIVNIGGEIGYKLTKTVNGFAQIVQGADRFSQSIFYTTTVTNKVVGFQATIAASGSTTIDLTSTTDLIGDAAVLTKAIGFGVTTSGANIKVTGGGTNGLSTWFIQASGELHIKDGGFAIIGWPETLPATVDATHKILTFTNTGAAAATVTFLILGGT